MRTIAFLLGIFLFCPSAEAQIDSLLLAAIKKNDSAAIVKRLSQNIDVNATDRYGANALMWAAYYCDLPVIKMFIAHGAKVQDSAVLYVETGGCYGGLQTIAAATGKLTLLQYAADSLKLPLGKGEYCLGSKKDDGCTPLSTAIYHVKADVAKYLISKGIAVEKDDDKGTSNALLAAAAMEQWSLFDLLIQTEAYQKRIGKPVADLLAASAQLKLMSGDKNQSQRKDSLFTQFLLNLTKACYEESQPGYAVGVKVLADASARLGRYEKADSLYGLAKELFLKSAGRECAQYFSILHNLARLHINKGRYGKALPVLEEEQELAKKIYGEASPEYTTKTKELALTADHAGQYAKSLSFYSLALEAVKKVWGENSRSYAGTLNNLAFLYVDMGQYAEALNLYQQSAALYKNIDGENSESHGGSLIDLGYTHTRLGQYKEALLEFEQALIIVRNVLGENHGWYAQSLTGSAAVHEMLGNLDKAIDQHGQALKIRKEAVGEEHPDYAESLQYLARLYLKKGEPDKAMDYHRQALHITEKSVGTAHVGYALRLNDVAAVFDRKKQYDSAVFYYEKAVAVAKKAVGENHLYYAYTQANLAATQANAGRYDTALRLLLHALVIRKKVLGEAHPAYAKNLNDLGILYTLLGRTDTASRLFIQGNNITLKHIARTFAVLSEQQKTALLDRESAQFHLLPSLLYASKGASPAALRQLYQNELALKGSVAEDQKVVLREIRDRSDSAALALYRQWRTNKTLLGKLLLASQRNYDLIAATEETLEAQEQKLSQLSEAFRSQLQQQHITFTSVAQNLSSDAAAVEFIRFRYYNRNWTDSVLYAALLLLPKDSVPHFIPLCEEKALQQLLAVPKNMDTAYALQKIYRPENSAQPDALYRLVWKPLVPWLRGVRTVYLAPAGLLHQVAFNALRDESSKCLVNRYTLHQVMSTRSVALPATPAPKPASAGLWGDIQYNASTVTAALQKNPAASHTASDFNLYTADTKRLRGGDFLPLPNTKKEIALLKESLRGKGINAVLYRGAEATEEAFKALDGQSPQVLHLATHGFFLPVVQRKSEAAPANAFTVQENPLFRSGLVLAGGNTAWKGKEPATHEDGILTAYEISQLDLSRTDLMVLSACETALGDVKANEGVIGLQRAIKLAGVKQMIVSLWRVPDKETVGVMASFYKHWLSGLSPGDGLRKAQLEMLKKGYPPFYWGGFVLIE